MGSPRADLGTTGEMRPLPGWMAALGRGNELPITRGMHRGVGTQQRGLEGGKPVESLGAWALGQEIWLES